MNAFPKTTLLACLALAMCLPSPGRAQDSDVSSAAKPAAPKNPRHLMDGDVWCGLFAAHPDADKGNDAGSDEESRRLLLTQLRKAFPDHASFRLIGENTESIFKEYECWIVPSRQLFVKIDSLGYQPDKSGGVHVHLQLWQEDHVLLKSDTILRRQPVFIAGPRWGDAGQLIMVLKLKREAGRTKE